MTRLFIVRHGETEWNARNLLQGSTDVPLSAVGHAQAADAARVLARLVSPDAVVVSSPLVRARDTAHALAEALAAPVHIDSRLRERSYGVWEGITPEERERGWPDAVARWHEHGNPDVPGFEPHDEVAARMVEAIGEWTERAPADIVAFSHGSAGRLGMMGLLRLSLEHRSLGNLGNTSWSVLSSLPAGGWRLDRHNVTVDRMGPRP